MTDNPLTGGRDSIVARLMRDPALGARRRAAETGAVFHETGAAATDVFAIDQGEVRLYQPTFDGSLRLLEILGPGDWFGTEAVGRLERYNCQAKAHSSASVFVLPASRLLNELINRPDVCLEIIQQLVARLNVATEEARGLAFDDCRQRLVKALLKFSRSAAATISGNSVVLRMTHEQLAQAVGAARETVSLTLTDLRNENVLRTGRNRLVFNPQTLSAVLNFD
jgi:CRP/FNR family transcriptional regulator